MNNHVSKILVIALLLLSVNQLVKGKNTEGVDAVSGATPVKLKIEANTGKQE